jgi:hypothetical protein
MHKRKITKMKYKSLTKIILGVILIFLFYSSFLLHLQHKYTNSEWRELFTLCKHDVTNRN